MKVILLQAVAGTGKINEVKEVSNGYALNFLLPRRLAVIATPAALTDLKQRAFKLEREALLKAGQAKDLSRRLKGKVVTVSAAVSQAGTLYAAVKAADVVAAIKEQYGLVVDKDGILLAEQLKTLGSHRAALRLPPAEEIDFVVNITKV